MSRAQAELKGVSAGQEAGHVFHELASYCHGQLVNPDNLEEFRRSETFKQKRLAEISELDNVLRSNLGDDQRSRARSERNKAKKWLEIDRVENERLTKSREQFLRQSLENYLLSLSASDENDSDVLRFVALWLEHANNLRANETVSKAITRVPSWKFAGLMNQLASRLQDDASDRFQQTISSVVDRICTEHPFHGMYHIFAGSNTGGGNDKTARSRHEAAVKVAAKLKRNGRTSKYWTAISQSNELYINLAHLKRQDSKGSTMETSSQVSRVVSRGVPQLKVPPITMSVQLRPDCEYGGTPTVVGFSPNIAFASGISAPKIVTAVASDGLKYKQLVSEIVVEQLNNANDRAVQG